MKNLFTILILAGVVTSGAAQQNILLVDNTPTAPAGDHVYSSLQDAINASAPGDIIHVKPSGTSYGAITITQNNDSISIFGIGINPDKEIAQSSSVSTLYITGHNIRISGLVVTSTLRVGNSTTQSTGNITLDNCRFEAYTYTPYSGVTSNVVFRNCLFYNYAYFQSDGNLTVVTNCIFSGNLSNQVYECHNGTLISHCLFFGNGTTHNAFYRMSNSTVSNSIFYGKEPNISDPNTNTNNTFNHCLAIHATDTVINAGTASGTITSVSGNVFASPDIVLQFSWNKKWDPALDPASVELIGAGDDGTDIGVTGGTVPYRVSGTSLPYIKSFIVPSVIKQGDDLDVTINAIGN